MIVQKPIVCFGWIATNWVGIVQYFKPSLVKKRFKPKETGKVLAPVAFDPGVSRWTSEGDAAFEQSLAIVRHSL